ncbi:MAG: hypothetical protein NT092_10080 [Bacteroidia bacterium]|nr:hypothetical protein [Bacteroidia bacterium]
MSYPGKTPFFQYAATDNDGNFNFVLPADDEYRDLIVQPDNIGAGYKVILGSAFSEQIPLTKLIIDTTAFIPPHILKWRLNSNISTIYELSNTGDVVKADSSHTVFKRFYGRPDFVLKMDDYVRLPLMEEIFFELVPRVRMKKLGSTYEITFLDPAGNKLYNDPPVLMVDGVIVKNASIIGDMNPDLVEQIDIVWGVYMVDEYMFHGIVNVITRTGDLSAVDLPANALRLSYRISEPVETFLSPDYSSDEKRQNRIPDFRNTLYWNPAITPDADGKIKIDFWSSDYATDYVINVQGISPGGEPVSIKKLLRIGKGGLH